MGQSYTSLIQTDRCICSNAYVEGYDILGMFNSLCDAVLSVAPPVALKRGPKTKETVESRYKAAMSTLERLA